MVSSADGLSTQQQPTQLESMFSIHPFLSAELSNQPQSEATVSSQPHGVVYTPVKVHDGPPRMHQSASATSSTDELQRYVRSPSSDDILRSDRRWYARPVASKPLFQQEQPSPLSIQHSSYSSMPMPTGTHTFPRYNSFPRSVKQSTGVSSITATTPPTPLTHHANYALLASRIHRSVTPPAATSKRISVPIELSQTPFRPVSQISGSEAGQPSPPEDDSSWVFQLPQPAGGMCNDSIKSPYIMNTEFSHSVPQILRPAHPILTLVLIMGSCFVGGWAQKDVFSANCIDSGIDLRPLSHGPSRETR